MSSARQGAPDDEFRTRKHQRMGPAVSWVVIRNATMAGLAIIVPLSLVASAAVRDQADTPTWARWLFGGAVVAGFSVAGAIAGWARRDTPMLHGGLAAGSTFVVAQLIGIVVRLVDAGSIDTVAILVTAVLAAACGVAGALGADWVHRRRVRAVGSSTLAAGESAG